MGPVKTLRLGYGVRLLPKPYNHPVRTAEIEGFGIDPLETREMWDEALGHIVGRWTNDEYEFPGKQSGMFDFLNMDYIYESGVVGDPDRCIEICRRYQAVGCELVLCSLNPYKIPHEEVMHSIQLLGKHVIPEFATDGVRDRVTSRGARGHRRGMRSTRSYRSRHRRSCSRS